METYNIHYELVHVCVKPPNEPVHGETELQGLLLKKNTSVFCDEEINAVIRPNFDDFLH